MSHTPGPWKSIWHRKYKQWNIFCPKDHVAVVSVHSCQGMLSDEETEANARLIAAAPDLLEAFQAAEWNSLDLPEFVREKLIAAIAKATNA